MQKSNSKWIHEQEQEGGEIDQQGTDQETDFLSFLQLVYA